ncbi:hypothetical protein BD626DRAFT_482562 [Schizophyllum amplum]|uniref:Uncharacterized protein n=1 Tax=Schizophyllum amplum TaxID=97359 RepID=A0A550CVA8_9AGAR|nr:hypothetical protein BD626DRAFT_482562 [Auriculariopsis ampla]
MSIVFSPKSPSSSDTAPNQLPKITPDVRPSNKDVRSTATGGGLSNHTLFSGDRMISGAASCCCRVGSLASGRETCLRMGSSWAWLALRRSPVPGTSLRPVTEAVSGPVSIAGERLTLKLPVVLTRGRRVVDVSRAIRGVGQLRRERRRWFLVADCPRRRSASGPASASPAS